MNTSQKQSTDAVSGSPASINQGDQDGQAGNSGERVASSLDPVDAISPQSSVLLRRDA